MNQSKNSPQDSALLGLKLRSKRLPSWLVQACNTYFDRLFGFNQFNEIYKRLPEHEDIQLSKVILDDLNIKLEVLGEPLNKSPSTGPQIFVANHPHGLVDGFALDHLINQARSNFQIMTMYIFRIFPEYEGRFALVDPLKKRKHHSMNVKGWRQAYRQVSKGGSLLVYPAGAVSRYHLSKNKVTDPDWNPHIATLARRTKATIIPIFIHGHNGLSFQISGLISRTLQNIFIFKELPKMQNCTLRISIGEHLPAETWSHISDDTLLINHFRDKVESLQKS